MLPLFGMIPVDSCPAQVGILRSGKMIIVCVLFGEEVDLYKAYVGDKNYRHEQTNKSCR